MIRGRRVQLRPVEEDDAPLIPRWQNSLVMSVSRDEFAAARARWEEGAGE